MEIKTVTLAASDYEAVREAVEVFREFVADVREGRRDYTAADINAVALMAAQADYALDQVVA